MRLRGFSELTTTKKTEVSKCCKKHLTLLSVGWFIFPFLPLFSGHRDVEQIERDKHGWQEEIQLKDLRTFIISVQCNQRTFSTKALSSTQWNKHAAQTHWHKYNANSPASPLCKLPVQAEAGSQSTPIFLISTNLQSSFYKFTIALNKTSQCLRVNLKNTLLSISAECILLSCVLFRQGAFHTNFLQYIFK